MISDELTEAKGRPSKAALQKAVKAMQLYLGSLDGYARVSDQERLRKKLDKIIARIVSTTGSETDNVWMQIEAEAGKRGKIRPQVGKDI